MSIPHPGVLPEIGIWVLAALPVASTLLLLCVPQLLQELLKLSQVTLIVLPPDT